MAIKKQKAIRLYWLFLKYLTVFCISTILLLVTLYAILLLGINSGAILPANYAEQAVRQIGEHIADMEEFDEAAIPFPCKYVLFDEYFHVLTSNMNLYEIEKAQDVMMNSTVYINEWYTMIHRKDSVCVISYDMYPHFSSPVLHKLLPNPQWCGIILFLVGFFAIAIVIALAFGRKLRQELEPIMEATASIKRQELHFDVHATRIQEFNTVLDSIQEMSTALEASLKQQWSLEQNRKMQISAITHDIKTPLTIIRGNTELLQESELCLEDKELLEYIQTSSDKIEKYLGLLIEATKAENGAVVKAELFSVGACIQELEVLAKSQCKAKNLVLMMHKETLPESFYGDKELIFRAVSNILENAIEYTPEHGEVEFIIAGTDEQLTFTVADNGAGFSEDSLRMATQEFYTERKERSGKHYGLGLFIAKTVAKRHNGELLLTNKADGLGAVVTLMIKSTIK